ncbi:MAG: proton-conducting transporter membrane subunit [Acidimicrobiales bacterium]
MHAKPLPVVCSYTWFSSGGSADSGSATIPWGTLVDGQSVLMLVVVTFISFLVHVFSTDYVHGDRRYTHYFAFLSLFTASMLFYVVSASTLQMIVGWELVGVCSFALIGHWWEDSNNSDAALKAFLTNRVSDIGLLVGMIILFFAAGNTFDVLSVNHAAVTKSIGHGTLTVASLCLLTAVMSKSGQFILTPGCPTPWPARRRFRPSSTPPPWWSPASTWLAASTRSSGTDSASRAPRSTSSRSWVASRASVVVRWRSSSVTSRRCWPTPPSRSSATWPWRSVSERGPQPCSTSSPTPSSRRASSSAPAPSATPATTAST